MKTATQKRKDLRAMLSAGNILCVPGVGDALTAKIAQMAGIQCLAMGGYSVTAVHLAQPDVGLLSMSEMATALKEICDATDIPVIADGDNGYGNALNVIRTESEFEKAGAACIFFEDQVWPKRCGHMDGKQVITADEHVQKIRAAVEARVDKETMIMARTDSRAVYGIEDAIERCKRYADAGAEMLFADGLCTREEIERFAKELKGSGAYLDANMIEGGKTPIIPAKELEQMGYSVVFWACSAVYTVSKALYDLFSGLQQNGTTEATAANMVEFGRFNHFVGLDHYKELERKYKVDRDD